MTAPLQLVTLTFPLGGDAERRVLAEVDQIKGRGVLRVLDMVIVAKGRDGTVEQLEVGDGDDFGSLLASMVPAASGNGDSPRAGADAGTVTGPANLAVAPPLLLADSLEPGNGVAFLLVEHHWAGSLAAAVSAAGGSMSSGDFLNGEASLAVEAEITEIEEAAAVIAEAQAVEAAAVLRAIKADAEAAEAEAASERIQAAAAADALHALLAAGLVEEAAAAEAVTALTTAGLIIDTAAQAADEAAADSAAVIAAADRAAAESVAEDAAVISAADEVAAEASEQAQARVRAASITRSEAQILQYLPQPVPFSVIASKLGISRSAARERAERLYQRLGVHSRADAVSRARELGLLRR